MRIVSTFLPPAPAQIVEGRTAVVFAFDTLVDQKGLVVGLTVGAVDGPHLARVRVSQVGSVVLERCAAHHAMNYPHGVAVVAGVAQVGGAVQRLRKVLAQAPQGALVLLVCADDKVYDAAAPALGIDYQSANAKPQ